MQRKGTEPVITLYLDCHFQYSTWPFENLVCFRQQWEKERMNVIVEWHEALYRVGWTELSRWQEVRCWHGRRPRLASHRSSITTFIQLPISDPGQGRSQTEDFSSCRDYRKQFRKKPTFSSNKSYPSMAIVFPNFMFARSTSLTAWTLSCEKILLKVLENFPGWTVLFQETFSPCQLAGCGILLWPFFLSLFFWPVRKQITLSLW